MNDLGLWAVCGEEMGFKISVKGFPVYTFSLRSLLCAGDWDTWLEEVDTMEVRDESHPDGSWHGEVWSSVLLAPQTLHASLQAPQESEGGAGLTNSIGINIHNIPSTQLQRDIIWFVWLWIGWGKYLIWEHKSNISVVKAWQLRVCNRTQFTTKIWNPSRILEPSLALLCQSRHMSFWSPRGLILKSRGEMFF